MRDGTLDLLISCLVYLCYKFLDGKVDKEPLQENLLSGKHRFHIYASSMWLDLAKQYIQLGGGEASSSAVSGLLTDLHEKLNNPEFKSDTEYPKTHSISVYNSS